MDEVWVHQCRDDAEFSAVGMYASDAEALAWGNAHTNKLYVHLNKSEAIHSFIRNYNVTVAAFKWKHRPDALEHLLDWILLTGDFGSENQAKGEEGPGSERK
ncbi:hypothetical protein THAOC_25364 [Thalassiosira oceanica]|uniref:Uncharacterized protein n=1 Tax=Thalassiosira oceanica TaxID=159749 RepID=K0S809_THAOC|nr:hypothetical protein THAOC_25364 [Thalassiosira oceanica]|eukprot:EJK54962.1 hypothetical protein THAOC_25364 [Thalassiosira oceanica]